MITSNNRGKIILDANQGIKIQGNTGSGFVDKFFVDTEGNVNFTGKLNGATGSFSGELTSATFKSGSININNKFIVDALGNCTATSMSITGGSFSSGNINGTNITGGSLNIGSGRFTVNSYGECTARDISILGGSIDVSENIRVGNQITIRGGASSGTIVFRDTSGAYKTLISGTWGGVGIDGSLTADNLYAPTIYMGSGGGSLVATRDWVDSQIGDVATREWVRDRYPVSTAYDSGTGNLKFYTYYGDEIRDMRVNIS
jgi:hypothetical protein